MRPFPAVLCAAFCGLLAGQTPSNPKAPEAHGPTARFHTTMGTLTCRLFDTESPVAVKTFLGLVSGSKDWTDPRTHALQHRKRFYDGMRIDRVVPGFVIQTGDITNDPSGAVDIGFRFPNETYPGLVFDRPGILAFGNAGKDTNNSELFFTERAVPRLNGGYTIIGRCDDASVQLIEQIARVPRDAHDAPVKPVLIERVDVQ